MKKYLTVKEVSHRYGIGVSTVWQWVKEGLLPTPRRFGQRCTRWDADVLDEHDNKTKSAA
ncbi:MAG: helix-turn-helix domain-containing protein [Candidatus Thiodiazotropha sp. (ex Ctena orbiculata)]|nr:helix-turn-helix domain-containing protein [Candidatus Thiodiazotropha taylori]PUB73112.1 MAG: AlpA family transcriptional regulator [gamma proteobacterium symbiont of Ctena orbiculata]